MEVIEQNLEDILESLGPLTVDWQDETARRVIHHLEDMPLKRTYSERDVRALLDANFEDGVLICRLFLGAVFPHQNGGEARSSKGAQQFCTISH